MFTPEDFFRERFPRLFDRPRTTGSLSSETLSALQHKMEGKIGESNTTILAIKCGKEAIIAADRRTSGGLYLFSDASKKVHQLTNFSAVAFTGTVSTIQETLKSISLICRNWDNNFYEPPSLDGQANLLSRMVRSDWEWVKATGWFDVGIPVLAGYDEDQQKPRIFGFDVGGAIYESQDFFGNGCGYDYIEGTLKDNWRKDLDRAAGVKLAVKALFNSGKSSIGVSDSQVTLPLIAVIGKEGFEWIPDKLIQKFVKKSVAAMEASR